VQGFFHDVSKRKQLEKQLRASEDRYRSICTALPDLLFRFDRDLRFVDAFAADPSQLALPREAFIGKSIQEVFGGAPVGEMGFSDMSSFSIRAADAVLHAIHTRTLTRFEYLFREHWYEARVAPCGHDEALAIARDITDIKAVELDIQQSRARFAWLVNQSPAVIYAASTKEPHATTFVSANVVGQVGYPPEHFIGDPGFVIAHIHPEDAPAVLAGRQLLLETGHSLQEFRFRTATGSYRWMLDEARLVTDLAGHATEILGSWTDISARHRLEEALQASEQRLALAIEASGLGVWDWDVVADEAYLSPRYWELVGYTEDDVRPSRAFFYSTVHPDDLPTVDKAMQSHLRGDTPESVVEYRARRKTGEYRWFHALGRVTARDERGTPLRMTGVILDITDQKTRAETLRTEEALRAALRARDNLLAVVSHDLRGPLSTIQLCAQHLTRKPPRPERRTSGKQLELVLRATERMKRLIDDLVQAAAIEAGMFTIEAGRQQVGAIIDDSLDALEGRAAAKSVRIERQVPRDTPAIWADSQRVVQVLSNLVGNALSAVPVGGTIRIAARARDKDVCFSVSDDGPGIPSDQMPHLFDRYWKGKGAGGVGLGLFIAKGIVERHGGQIWAESRVGVGSVFSFTIPTVGA